MAIVVDPGLLEYMASHSGSCTFVLSGVPEAEAVEGMRSACRAVGSIPHPEEPEDPLPSYMSGIAASGDGARFTVDMADAEGYDGLLERVLDAVLEGLAAAGVDGGLLTYPAVEPTPTIEEVTSPAPPPLPPSPIDGTSWSVVGIPLPDPHQELWASGSGTEHAAGYMLPHDTEFLLRYFELLPGTLLSYTAAPAGEMPFAAIYMVMGGRAFFVRIRDAGTARNVEVTVETDNRKVEGSLLEFRSAAIPPGVEIRVDRRRG